MAQKVLIQLVSDLTGDAIPEGKGETVAFALDGKNYEVDLTKKEADKLRGLFQDYIAVGRHIGTRTGAARRRGGPSGRSGISKEDSANIRAWARKNGYEVSDRGRISQTVVEAYHAAR